MAKKNIGKGILVVVLIFAISVVSCGNRNVNRANYDRIQHGMTRDQVIEIMGQPSNSGATMNLATGVSTLTLIWRHNRHSFMIVTLSGRIGAQRVVEKRGYGSDFVVVR